MRSGPIAEAATFLRAAFLHGKVIVNIRNNEPYYGEASILGKTYVTAYEPIRDSANKVIGIYYVGYLKEARYGRLRRRP